MALIIGHSQVKYLHQYIEDSSIITLAYPGSRIDQLWSSVEDIVPAFEVSIQFYTLNIGSYVKLRSLKSNLL